jgi:hypothetical protein
MLEQAVLVGHGVRSGLNMHRARHSFATDLRRIAGIEAARRLSGTATCPRRSESTDTETSATSNERWTHSLPPDRQTPTARRTISSDAT